MSTSQVGLGKHKIPSLNSPSVSFHPSYPGASARNSFIFESILGTVEGFAIINYAEPCIRWLATESSAITPLVKSLTQVVGCIIIAFHSALALGIPNRRTNVEGRLILQANFEVIEIVGALGFGWLAAKGEQATGLRSDRLWLMSGLVTFFGIVRVAMAFRKDGWAGAYLEEEEGGKKGQ